jgi:CheY-like chemotaxis protein
MYVEFLRHHGFAVMGIPDAWDALTVAPDADVIVTGILLASSIDGHELIARLRNDGRTNQTPIIVLTACAWTTERERAERAGCDVFLEKPCLPSDLLRHVRGRAARKVIHSPLRK